MEGHGENNQAHVQEERNDEKRMGLSTENFKANLKEGELKTGVKREHEEDERNQKKEEGMMSNESQCQDKSMSEDSQEQPEQKRKKTEAECNDGFNPVTCRKRKVALLLGYSGSGYFGMQKNPGVKTIEHDLIDALYKADAIKEEVKDDMGKMAFQRAARTDKGVSAARQIVSLNPEIVPLVNKHLPSSIRVFGVRRVTRSFDSKNNCSSRTYEYLLPTFAFAPTYMETTASYRIKDHVLGKVNSFLKRFEGTHNFHNFTSGRLSTDASSHRYIINFHAGKPFVRKGSEFIVLSVTGQSFVLHQIRKMIGLCIAYSRGYCGFEVLTKAWGRNKVDIPKAPGLGLVLDKVHYDAYNKKFGSDGVHEPLTWEETEECVQQFKEKYIWSTIIDTEITQHSMMIWLSTLKNHTYDEEGILRSMERKANKERELLNNGINQTDSPVTETSNTSSDSKVDCTDENNHSNQVATSSNTEERSTCGVNVESENVENRVNQGESGLAESVS